MQRKVKPEKPVLTKADPTLKFDYKEVEGLRRFLTEKGRLLARSRTGLSARQQRDLARAVKRARMLALLPFAD